MIIQAIRPMGTADYDNNLDTLSTELDVEIDWLVEERHGGTPGLTDFS